jgi:hypothetical protein
VRWATFPKRNNSLIRHRDNATRGPGIGAGGQTYQVDLQTNRQPNVGGVQPTPGYTNQPQAGNGLGGFLPRSMNATLNNSGSGLLKLKGYAGQSLMLIEVMSTGNVGTYSFAITQNDDIRMGFKDNGSFEFRLASQCIFFNSNDSQAAASIDGLNNKLSLRSTGILVFTNGSATATPDVGLARQSAGILRISDGTAFGLGTVVVGNTTLLPLTTPTGVTVTRIGTAGSTTYGYRVSAVDGRGETLASSTVQITTGNATLTGGNFNRVTWNAVTNAVSYKVYGRTSGSELFMQTIAAGTLQFDDTGTVTPSGALPGSPSGNRLLVQQWNGQTQNPFEMQDVGGTVLTSITPSGNVVAPNHIETVPVSFGDGTVVIGVNAKQVARVKVNGTILGWTIVTDQTGSITIDVKKSTFSGYPTTSTICGGNKPAVSSARKAEDTTLTSWTLTVNAGDVLEFNVDSVSACTWATIMLDIKRT